MQLTVPCKSDGIFVQPSDSKNTSEFQISGIAENIFVCIMHLAISNDEPAAVTPLVLQQLRHLCCTNYAINVCSSYATCAAAVMPLASATVTPLVLPQLCHLCCSSYATCICSSYATCAAAVTPLVSAAVTPLVVQKLRLLCCSSYVTYVSSFAMMHAWFLRFLSEVFHVMRISWQMKKLLISQLSNARIKVL